MTTPHTMLRRAERNVEVAQRNLNYYRGLLRLQQRNAPHLERDALPDVITLEHRIRHAESVLELALQYRAFLRHTVPTTGAPT